MKSQTLFNLKPYNSFAVRSVCSHIYYLQSVSDLNLLTLNQGEALYVLGEGSNTLFVDADSPVIIKPEFKGITVTEDELFYTLEVAAGENWHKLVEYCLHRGINGLENLALIPGSVGAAPVQNIGAYGVEFSDFCYGVSWFEFDTKQHHFLSHAQCEFSYRHSLFKEHLKNKGVITQVTLRIPKRWKSVLTYHGLDTLPLESNAQDIMLAVIALREAKLPDPNKLPNAGSFFKNPEITHEKYVQLKSKYFDIPSYLLPDHKVKIAAGWLIDKCGLKGFTRNNVGVHDKQALVLVNYNSINGQDVVSLARYVQTKVFDTFDIILEPEVRAVYSTGEAPMNLDKQYD